MYFLCQLRRPRNNDSIKMCTFNTYIMISKHYFPLKGTRAPWLILNAEQGISLESEKLAGDEHCLDYSMRSLQKSTYKAPSEHQEVMMQYNPLSMIKILWPPDSKNWLIGKDPDAGKYWRWEEKGKTEDEMVGWHRWLNGQEFE